MVKFEDTPEYKVGRVGEQKVVALLRSKGWHVIPSYEYKGEESKAPKLISDGSAYVLPDLDVSKEGSRYWIEVKTKHRPTVYRRTGIVEHGIDLRHWQDYQHVQRITGCCLYIAFYELDSGLILVGGSQRLERHSRVYDGSKMGRGGMIFFERSRLRPIGKDV